MRGIGFSLAPLMLLVSGTAVAADAGSAPSRINLAMSEERQPLAAATQGLLSDGAVLLAFADLTLHDTSVAQASILSNPVLEQGAEPQPLLWASLLPPVTPADESAEARQPTPLPEEEPCKLGLVCRESDLR